ncbi:MAG: thiamine diphosphokinase [Caldilineaceae bacterium]
MTRAIIFVNGLISDYARLAKLLRADDLLIGADGGARHAIKIGRLPHIVVGDMDSLSAAEVAQFAAQGVRLERHKPEKDQTDLELAIERALAEGATQIVLVGAQGDRLDQSLANLLILAQRDWPAHISVVENGQRAQIARGGQTILLEGAPGDVVSAIPLSPRVTGITYRGLRYPLHNAELPLGSTRGISNELAAPSAAISIRSGLLLVTHIERYNSAQRTGD